MMLNKKAQAVGISPLKMLISFFIVVICFIILLIAMKAMEESQGDKTKQMVEAALGEQVWQAAISKKVDNKLMSDILQDYQDAVQEYYEGSTPEIVSRMDEATSLISKACEEVINEIIPDKVSVKKVHVGHGQLGYEGEHYGVYCHVDLESQLSKEAAIDALEAAGFGQDPYFIERGYLGFIGKVPEKDFSFEISASLAKR